MAKFNPKSRDELAKYATEGPLPTSEKQSLHNELLQTVSDMGFADGDLRQVPTTVRQMTVADLNDFARKMSGVPQNNPLVNKLTVKDIQGVEFLFGATKNAALSRVASVDELAELEIDVSCCCCTPCCCCAATDVQPFAA